MIKKCLRRPQLASCILALTLLSVQGLAAQTQPTTHNLTITNVDQSIDVYGRIVVTSNVQGDLPGTLTLALVVGADGRVTGGEWALNVSSVQFGPISPDGDASESLVQLGVIKGSVSGGSADLSAGGLITDLSGVALNVTGATLQFAGTTSGNGTFAGSNMTDRTASSGSVNVTF